MSRPQRSSSGVNSPKRARGTRRFPVVVVASAVVLLVGVLAIVVSAGDDSDPGGSDAARVSSGFAETRAVEVKGAGLPPMPEGSDSADSAIGKPAPVLDGAAFDGEPIRIGPDGRPKVLVFLAHWCPHCQREVPVLVDWLAEHGKPSDVDIYGIATGSTKDRPNFPPSTWLEKEGWDLPTVADSADGTAGMSFGLSAFPFFVALDADNDVVARGSGELSTEEWEGLLDAARSGAAV